MFSQVKMSPKDFFLNIAVVATLYVSAVSLITLWFQYIDRLFPDPLQSYTDPFSGAIRFAIASLIIIFPLYIGLTRYQNQDIRKHPEKKELGIHRWLIYLTLFIAGVTIVIDLIVLINTFLGGDLTTRFMLKVAVILLVIGDVFFYYYLDLKGRWKDRQKQSVMIGWIVSILVLGSIVSGFFIIGSPQTQRELRLDQQRISDLSSIQWQITNFWQSKERLPESLAEIEDPLVGFIVPVDPQTGVNYVYGITAERSFELCATFNQNSLTNPNRVARVGPASMSENWEHGIGEVCFERTIDSDRFPPFEKAIPMVR